MKDNEDNDYKATAGGGSAFRNEIQNDIQQNMEKFKDPVILGEMLYKLLEERENTNRILKNILTKLEALEVKGIETPKMTKQEKEVMLPEIDQEIMKFIKNKGKVTAEKVRVQFKYKGKNAASARLNKLCTLGLLRKKQVGKRVFFFPI